MNRINIKEVKNSIRTEYKAKRKLINAEQKAEMDEAICKRFLSLSSYRFADTVLLFAPLQNEINTYPIAQDALAKGKKLAFPRCIEGNDMVYHYVNSLDQLKPGKYGIMEPSDDLPLFNNDGGHTVCILPAIVYDKKGYRLGYGKGYYDRFLSSFKGVKVGLVYNDFIINEVPIGRYDLPSDIVITEKRVISFAKN
ncbi:MAG: 5-formyltetrahydrofolate cyclo-ligase [Clostridia bacterium]|nr:5-formyltetrahydrofolate cyclo-ligase [Clostridia bacterium]